MAKAPFIAIREGVGPRSVDNPNRVEPKGTYWDPVTGKGGQPAPPAPSVQEERAAKVFNDAIMYHYDVSHYLRNNPADAQKVAEAVTQLRAAGKSPQAAVNEVVNIVRSSVPELAQRPADEGVWRANVEAARLEALRPKIWYEAK
jgi:hypothetical protein